jgi:hypothetical protein
MRVNGVNLPFFASNEEAVSTGSGTVWNARTKILSVFAKSMSVDKDISFEAIKSCSPGAPSF